jgi:hypothetical protein
MRGTSQRPFRFEKREGYRRDTQKKEKCDHEFAAVYARQQGCIIFRHHANIKWFGGSACREHVERVEVRSALPQIVQSFSANLEP